MIFTDPNFLFMFLPVVIGAFLIVRELHSHSFVVPVLLVSSVVFYAQWHWQFIFLLLLSLCFNYLFARHLLKHPNKYLLALAVSVNLLLLCYYKYAGFLVQNLSMFGYDIAFAAPILPLAISFFTFQQIAFVVDAHRQEVELTTFSRYSLFVCFFPQLIAGPIVNYKTMQPQIDKLSLGLLKPSYYMGMAYLCMGIAKKLIIADPLGEIINPIFMVADTTGVSHPVTALIAALGYSFQLYFDFSAYADMAIGLGLLFGLQLPVNFLSPYKATSIIEFWRRWHITLSDFLKNYLYIPIGGGRCSPNRRKLNLMITMLLGGLWHGASWNFVLWGGLHGLMLVINHTFRAIMQKMHIPFTQQLTSVSIFVTFILVTLTWVLFRAETFDGAFAIYAALMSLHTISISDVQAAQMEHGVYLVKAVGLLAMAMAMAFGAPNTHEIFKRLQAISLKRQALVKRVVRHPLMAISSGVGVFAAGKSMMAMPPAAFLYFNF